MKTLFRLASPFLTALDDRKHGSADLSFLDRSLEEDGATAPAAP